MTWLRRLGRDVRRQPAARAEGPALLVPGAGFAALGGPAVMRDLALQASYRFCRGVARREAKNFYHAFLLLPPGRRRSMCALYAFLRRTDDLADQPGPAAGKDQALRDWRLELEAALAGENPAWPGLLALTDTVARACHPRETPS